MALCYIQANVTLYYYCTDETRYCKEIEHILFVMFLFMYYF
jgi:hypothetical protein